VRRRRRIQEPSRFHRQRFARWGPSLRWGFARTLTWRAPTTSASGSGRAQNRWAAEELGDPRG